MLNNFEVMDDTVDKICQSLKKQPHLWVFEPCTLKDTVSLIEYWVNNSGPITHRWEKTTIRVFSDKQGSKIREAYDYAISHKANALQQDIINSYKIIKKEKNINKQNKNEKSFLSSFWNWFK